MANIRIKIKEIGTDEELQHCKNWMMESVKCMNKFCYGTYNFEDVVCAHVIKKDDPVCDYLIPLCKDCCNEKDGLGY